MSVRKRSEERARKGYGKEKKKGEKEKKNGGMKIYEQTREKNRMKKKGK